VEAADAFGDLDLRAVTRSDPVSLAAVCSGQAFVGSDPTIPLLYTGPLENEPDLLRRLAACGLLLGNAAEIVEPVRDPFRLSATLRAAGVATPDLALSAPAGLSGRGWLLKHRQSSGGTGVEPYSGQALGDGGYLQQKIDGQPRSALFLGDAQRVVLIGMSACWSGAAGRRYVYRGGLAPLPIPDPLRETLERIGRVLHQVFGLRGLFGVDLIVCDGIPWVLEVNPRYTASVELFEYATGHALLRAHARAFGVEPPAEARRQPRPLPTCVGKAVVYTRHDLLWSRPATIRSAPDPWRLPRHADLPAPGSRFRPGEPVLTLLESGPRPTLVAHRLRRRLARWRGRLKALAQATA
jgi:predicted ATP-grasp superfamily ATP-dependent carboligase